MSNIVIDIAAEFTGNKAFKQAENSTDNLIKNVKKLAKTLGVAYGSQQILAFGKASIKAAAADQKAQQQLALALNNVGLGRDASSSEAYIQRLQSEFGIVDDKLRPAYQTLAVATRDTSEAQKLLNLSLDISASTGKDLGTVTAALSKAYLGNNTALSKLGVGISKADLKAGKFDDIVAQLSTTFAGSATAAANTFQGSIDKLGVASANVKEIIGTGLIDALTNLGKDTSVSDLAKDMEDTATYLADVIRGIGVLGDKLKNTPIIGQVFGNLNVGMIPIVGSYLELLRKAGKQAEIQKSTDNQHLLDLQSQFKVTSKIVNNAKKLTASELATLKAKQLQTAIDKANLALGKGEDIFNMDKIQIAAALTSQAEQLGKATTGAQILQIANDTARLKVKQDILALEDAIASGDQKAIEAATKKLNADMAILGSLQNQSIKLLDIKSILDTLKPKDLINLDNLNEALRLLGLINSANKGGTSGGGGGGGGGGTSTGSGGGAGSTTNNQTPSTTVYPNNTGYPNYGLQNMVTPSLTNTPFGPNGTFNIEDVARSSFLAGLTGGAGVSGAASGARYAAQAAAQYNITIQAGIGDPNAIAEAVNQVIQDAVDRGTLRGGAY
jgi:hypothetical protein